MGGTQQAPPLRRKPVYRRQVFAHVLSVDCACPACGEVVMGRPYRRRKVDLPTRQKLPRYGYDPHSGRFTCPRCRHVFVLGVIFWPTSLLLRVGRAVDTVPTLEEALVLREAASRVSVDRARDKRAPVNVVEESAPPSPPLSDHASDDPLIE